MASTPSTPAGTTPNTAKMTIAKLSSQIKQLQAANAKYKELLVLAKERIQQAESKEPMNETKELEVVRLIQRVRQDDIVWALMEFQTVLDEDSLEEPTKSTEWRFFSSADALDDFMRRDNGEPLPPPPSYSYTPEQATQLESEWQEKYEQLESAFTKFRVSSQLQKAVAVKPQSVVVQAPQQPQPTAATETETIRKLQHQVSDWQSKYDTLRQQFDEMQQTGAEAAVAVQWRQRYEHVSSQLQALRDTTRELEALREKQENVQEVSITRKSRPEKRPSLQLSAGDNSKLSYLRNCMVAYWTTDDESRKTSMQTAISTILQLDATQLQQIDDFKKSQAWFYT